MELMVASRSGAVRLTSKLLVLGLCLGLNASHVMAQSEEPPVKPEGGEAPAEPAATPETPAPAEDAATPEVPKDEAAPIKDKIDQLKKARVKNRKETTDAVMTRRGKDPEVTKYVVVGEAQVLPAKVIRVVYARRNIVSSESFETGGGAKKNIGIDLVANVNAYAVQYGLTDKISLQVLIPMVAENSLTIDADKFRDSKIYNKNYMKLVDAVVPTFIAAGTCTDYGDCVTRINDGTIKLPVNNSFVLPTGETYTAPKNAPVKEIADRLVASNAKPKQGVTGMSDIAMGAMYSAYTDPNQSVSVAAGLRLPTSKHDDEKVYNRTGAGFTDVAVVFTYDYKVADPFVISVGQMFEHHLKNPRYKRHSQVNPDELNQADPNTIGADLATPLAGNGDRVSNNFEVTRKGDYNTGHVRFAFALGALVPALSPFSTTFSYIWAHDHEQYFDGVAQENGSSSRSVNYTLNFDGLGLQPRIPIGLSLAQDRYLSGDNVSVAGVTTQFSLALYYKF